MAKLTAAQRDKNLERGERGADVLGYYRNTYDDGANDQEALTDLLADILHAIDQKSTEANLKDAVEMADIHFNCEKDGLE